ncbi:MAG: hypothetical protein ACXQS5_00190 [Candidatus Methanospirareceae archaeon]
MVNLAIVLSKGIQIGNSRTLELENGNIEVSKEFVKMLVFPNISISEVCSLRRIQHGLFSPQEMQSAWDSAPFYSDGVSYSVTDDYILVTFTGSQLIRFYYPLSSPLPTKVYVCARFREINLAAWNFRIQLENLATGDYTTARLYYDGTNYYANFVVNGVYSTTKTITDLDTTDLTFEFYAADGNQKLVLNRRWRLNNTAAFPASMSRVQVIMECQDAAGGDAKYYFPMLVVSD